MQVSHAIRERRSIRAFSADPLDTDAVAQILELAKWAPSWANTQDWNVFVVAGEPLARIKAAFVAQAEQGVMATTDLPMQGQWPEYLSARMNMRRPPSEAPDAARPSAVGPSIWEFYEAPCLVLLAIDPEIEPSYACFDAGLFTQTLLLAAEDRGFASCVMAMAVRFPEILHAEIPAAQGKRFVVGIALGYADHTAVSNREERTRVTAEEIVTFVRE
jgi:nitroreductase